MLRAKLLTIMLAALLIAVVFSAAVGSADTSLVPAGSIWKYLDDGTDQGSAWRESGFNDSSWSEGPAQLGYGDGDETTVVSYGPDPNNKYVTTYFRHHFSVTDPGQYPCLVLRLLGDDGVVVYLNGAETYRSNMPAGTVNHMTFATSAVGGDDEDAYAEAYVYPNPLPAGANTLAVEVHQCSRTSSDISFDLELVGCTELPPLMRKAPYLIYTGTNTEMKVIWQLALAETCTIEWGTDTSYSMGSSQTTEHGTDHQHTYTLTGLSPGALFYYRVSAGGDQYTGSFHAAPAADSNSLKFMAYGDTRTYPADHDSVAAAMLSECIGEPEYQSLIICVGDLVTDGDLESEWDTEFFDPSYTNIQGMLGCLPYQAAMGNHEGSGVLFVKYFPYPFVSNRYWSFDYGPAHFTVVDQYTSYSPGSAQLDWIESDLAATGKPWKFIYLHEPGWSAGGHGNNTSVQNYIQPLCEQYGVSILFAGHNHYYARAVVNGIQHVTTGGGGAPLRTPDPAYPNIVTASEAFHYCKLDIEGGRLWFEAITPDGVVLDTLSLALPGTGSRPDDGDAAAHPPALDFAGPNPFGSGIEIRYSIPRACHAEVSIYTIDGQQVRCLVDAARQPGRYVTEWDGTDGRGRPVSSGIYMCRLRSDRHSIAGKLVLTR